MRYYKVLNDSEWILFQAYLAEHEMISETFLNSDLPTVITVAIEK